MDLREFDAANQIDPSLVRDEIDISQFQLLLARRQIVNGKNALLSVPALPPESK